MNYDGKFKTNLNELLRQDVKWNWSEDCEEASCKLKQLIAAEPVLAHYDHKLELKLACDASSYELHGGSCNTLALYARWNRETCDLWFLNTVKSRVELCPNQKRKLWKLFLGSRNFTSTSFIHTDYGPQELLYCIPGKLYQHLQLPGYRDAWMGYYSFSLPI